MAVCDSGPLIHLSRIGRTGLLKEFFEEILIPVCVERETLKKAKELGKPGTRPIEKGIEEEWIKIEKIREREEVEKLAESEKIEPEDAEVLQLVQETSSRLITNDSWLVKIAKAEGIKPIWTTTLVLLAVKRDKMEKSEGKKLIKELVRSGLYLKSELYAELLETIEKL